MARLAIYALSVPMNPDAKRDEKEVPSSYAPGDLVSVVEDGVTFGADIERGYPLQYPGTVWWRIVEVPGEPAANFAYLLARDPGNSDETFKTDLGWSTHKRSKNVDLASLEVFATGKAGKVLEPGDAVTLDKTTELSLVLTSKVITKTPVPQSAVIG